MTYFDADALPPCEFSTHCVRLLNDLDGPGDARAFELVFSTTAKDRQDEQLIEELRAHLPNCPTCSATLGRARQMRAQQRMALRRYLLAAESRVPATSDRILAALRQERQEQPQSPQKRRVYVLPEVFVPLFVPKSHSNGSGHHGHATGTQPPGRSNRWLRNGFAIVTAAALLLAAMGIFSHFLMRVSPGSQITQGKSWSSFIIGVSLLSVLPGVARSANVYNVDTANGQSEQITPTIQSAEEVQFETVSPDGKNMLYHYSDQGQTVYSTLLPVSGRSSVASIPDDDASNAIWMDNDHILVAHVYSGAEELDIHNGSAIRRFDALANVHLIFYHAPYVYFQDTQKYNIYRSNLSLATSQRQQITPVSASGVYFSNCILNADGSKLYCEGQTAQNAVHSLYVLNSDGTGFQALGRQGELLGFAVDHALLYLQAMANTFQVVKLGQTLRQDQVVMPDIAPGATSLSPGDAVLAPDGHALIVQDSNEGDAARGVWFDDLGSHSARRIMMYSPGMIGQVIGWDQLPISVNAPTPGYTVQPQISPTSSATTAPGALYDGWNGVVLVSGTGAGYNLISSYNYLNGDHRAMAAPGANIEFDGVASSGLDMLYHVNVGQHTLFYTLHQVSGQGYFFELQQDNVLNAIWMPDSIHVLIATTGEGVIEVNTQTGQSQPFLPSLRAQALKFYRDGYLYFLGGPDRAGDTLFRINITTGVVRQITFRSMGGDFWLSPGGITVYFKNGGPVGRAGIYAVSSDGTKGGWIRSDGTPIGYASDGSLVIMREVEHRFEVEQLGTTPQQDRVLLSNAAPGALSLCDPSFADETICDTTNIALAPYGHALIVVASYADGSRKVWSDDLTSGKQFVMLTLSQTTTLMAPGWDRVVVP